MGSLSSGLLIGVTYSLLLLISTEECSWIQKMTKRDVKMVITGEGLHRNLIVSTQLESNERFIECRILYNLKVPKGMYVDSDSVNSSLPLHSLHSRHYFDVEAPEKDSKEVQVSIVSTKITRKQFIISDYLTLPIHIRYHSPDSIDYGIHSLDKCHTATSKSVQSLAAKWVIVDPLSVSAPVTVSIPTGNRSMLPTVVTVTSSVVVLSLIFLSRTLFFSK